MRKWLPSLITSAMLCTPVFAETATTVANEESTPTALDLRLQGEKQASGLGRVLTAHRPTYILPITYSESPNNKPLEDNGVEDYRFEHWEIKYQFSVKAEVVEDMFTDNGDLYFAYTQQSMWQAYDSDNSSPFRDTNYEPEMFVAFDTEYDVFGLNNRMITLGFAHQSNGRGADAYSRSWNRVFATFLFDRGNFAMQVKPWYRIPEDDDDDENPNIEDYVGYGDVKMAYKMDTMEFATILRNNLKADENRGSIQLDWTFPLVKEIRGYVQYFNGYEETLLDYNHHDQRIGIGFMLGEWL